MSAIHSQQTIRTSSISNEAVLNCKKNIENRRLKKEYVTNETKILGGQTDKVS